MKSKHTQSPSGSRASSRKWFKGGAGDTGKAGAWRFFESKKDSTLMDGTGITVSTGVTITVDDVEKGADGNYRMPEPVKYNEWSRAARS